MGDYDNLRLFHTGDHACGYWPDRTARDLVFDPHDDRLPRCDAAVRATSRTSPRWRCA